MYIVLETPNFRFAELMDMVIKTEKWQGQIEIVVTFSQRISEAMNLN